jgi:hypothetical protein
VIVNNGHVPVGFVRSQIELIKAEHRPIGVRGAGGREPGAATGRAQGTVATILSHRGRSQHLRRANEALDRLHRAPGFTPSHNIFVHRHA